MACHQLFPCSSLFIFPSEPLQCDRAANTSLFRERPAVGRRALEVGIELNERAFCVASTVEQQAPEAHPRSLGFCGIRVTPLQRTVELNRLLEVTCSSLRVRVAEKLGRRHGGCLQAGEGRRTRQSPT